MKSYKVQKILIILGLILVVIIGQILTLFLENPTITNFPPRGTHIIALGDSFTTGIGATDPVYGYVSILANRLNVPIENRGISGNTTHDALLRLNQDVLKGKPDIVMVLLGGNDYLNHIPTEETFANLQEIITRIQSQGAIVLLIGVQEKTGNDHDQEKFATLAHKTGAMYVPNVLKGIIGNRSLMYDEIHPNNKGYEKIADKIAPSLLGLISSVPSLAPTE